MNKPYTLHKSIKKNAKTLALIAGSGEGRYRWIPFIEKLTQHFNVFVVDNPGVGDAPVELLFTVEQLAERYHNYLQELGINKYYLLGHSLGSFIAQNMAYRYNDNVEKLVLISSSVGSFNQVGIINGTIDMTNNGFRSILGDNFTDEQYEAFIANEVIHSARIGLPARFAFALATTKFTSVDYIQKITQPTLLIHGKQDSLVTFNNLEQLASLIPNNKVIILDNVGHMPIIEEPTVLASVIAYFNGVDIGVEFKKSFNLNSNLLKFNKNFITNVNSAKYKRVLTMTLAGLGSKEKRLKKYQQFLARNPQKNYYTMFIEKILGK